MKTNYKKWVFLFIGILACIYWQVLFRILICFIIIVLVLCFEIKLIWKFRKIMIAIAVIYYLVSVLK